MREKTVALQAERIDDAEVTAALASFSPVWEQLSANERARVIQLLVQSVEYDGREGSVSITFHPSGIKALAHQYGHEVAA